MTAAIAAQGRIDDLDNFKKAGVGPTKKVRIGPTPKGQREGYTLEAQIMVDWAYYERGLVL